MTFDESILEQYNYFNIDFTEFNYIFILSGLFDNNFKSLYPNILKNSLILFEKDFKEADKLLNEYEKEIGNKKKFILISPCDELEANIATFHGNKSIYYFIGYCLNYNHEHDFNFLFNFYKYYTIIDSSEELIEQLFKLNILFSYRKKQNYKVKNKMTETFELNDEDTNFLKDFNNECAKNNTIVSHFYRNYKFKMDTDESYFIFIQSLTLLNKYLEDKNYTLLFNIFGNLANRLTKYENKKEKLLYSINLLKNLHILYLYFSHYPYLYEAITDEELEGILSKFKSDLNRKDLLENEIFAFNSIIQYVDNLASKVSRGLSILNEKFELKILQKLFIEIHCSNDVLYKGYKYSLFIEYYQVKNFLRDIDFCIGIALIDIIRAYLGFNYPLTKTIHKLYLGKELRYSLNNLYSIQEKKLNDDKSKDKPMIVYNNSIKFKDTIVLGDKQFHKKIREINLPCENIFYFNEEEFYNFCLVPKKIRH